MRMEKRFDITLHSTLESSLSKSSCSSHKTVARAQHKHVLILGYELNFKTVVLQFLDKKHVCTSWNCLILHQNYIKAIAEYCLFHVNSTVGLVAI